MDKKMKHTPGPWECGTSAGIYANGVRLAYILYCLNSKEPFKVMGKEAQANARLIAAAPDLLEALKQLLNACKRNDILTRHILNAEQAIAKVERG